METILIDVIFAVFESTAVPAMKGVHRRLHIFKRTILLFVICLLLAPFGLAEGKIIHYETEEGVDNDALFDEYISSLWGCLPSNLGELMGISYRSYRKLVSPFLCQQINEEKRQHEEVTYLGSLNRNSRSFRK